MPEDAGEHQQGFTQQQQRGAGSAHLPVTGSGGMLLNATLKLVLLIFQILAPLKRITGKQPLRASKTQEEALFSFPISEAKALLTARIFSWISESLSPLKGEVKATTNMMCPSLTHYPKQPKASSIS